MPHYFVLQPNGKYAIYSTIVDGLLELDLTKEDAIAAESSLRMMDGYPGGPDVYKKDLQEEMVNIEAVGRAYDWAMTWNETMRYFESARRGEELAKVDELKLPRRMKPYTSSLRDARYWVKYWRHRAERAEYRLSRLQLTITSEAA